MKQTEIGLIPDDWEVKKLGNITTHVDYRGKTPKKTNMGIQLITAKNIRMGYIDYKNNQEFVSPTDYSEVMKRGLPQKGDVLITTEAPAGNVAQIDNENIALAQRVIKYRGNETLNNDYLCHYFLSDYFQNLLRAMNTGGTVQGIKGSLLHTLPVIVPPLPEQQRIAKALSDVDAAISTIEKLIQKKKNIKQGTMQNLLTGKKRLPGFAKSTNYKQSELGLIPEDWEVKKLSDVIQNVKIKQIIKEPLVCGDFPVIQQGNIPIAGYSSGEPFIDYKNAIIFGDHTLSLFKPKKPFFVSSDGLKVLLINKGNPEYFYYLMNMYMPESEGYKRHFSIIKQILIPVTNNILEQTAIANVLSSMDKEIETLNTKLEKYRDLKTAMMQQLLTGKIRLKGEKGGNQ